MRSVATLLSLGGCAVGTGAVNTLWSLLATFCYVRLYSMRKHEDPRMPNFYFVGPFNVNVLPCRHLATRKRV